MAEIKQIFYSEVKSGKLNSEISKRIAACLKHFEGEAVEISIGKKKSKRSTKQNALWWVYMTLLQEETGQDKEELHDLCKNMFLKKPIELINKTTGEIHQLETNISTRELSKIDFMELIDKLQRWASDFLGIYLPIPDEQTTFTL